MAEEARPCAWPPARSNNSINVVVVEGTMSSIDPTSKNRTYDIQAESKKLARRPTPPSTTLKFLNSNMFLISLRRVSPIWFNFYRTQLLCKLTKVKILHRETMLTFVVFKKLTFKVILYVLVYLSDFGSSKIIFMCYRGLFRFLFDSVCLD